MNFFNYSKTTIRALICDGAVDPHEFLWSDPPVTELLREKVQTGRARGDDEFVRGVERPTSRQLCPLPAGRS